MQHDHNVINYGLKTRIHYFEFTVIEECKEEDLKQREKDLIEEFDAVESGYNTVQPTLESGSSITIKIEEKLLEQFEKKIKELKRLHERIDNFING